MGRFARTWALTKESLAILKANPHLSVFPILSGIASIVVCASFFVPLAISDPGLWKGNFAGPHYLLLAAFYAVSYFVVIFFNSALVSCAYRSFRGEPSTVKQGLADAARHLPAIIFWSLIAATVGTILRIIGERGGLIGQIISALVGTAWSLVTAFVVPVIILENAAPFPAIKQSGSYLRKTWGETLIAGASLGLVGLVLGLGALIPITAAIMLLAGGMWVPAVPAAAIAVLYCLFVAVVMSAVGGIFNTGLYLYAATGQVPAGFSPEYVQGAFEPKSKKGFFKAGGRG
jgi:hypothetical protein